MVQLVHDSGWSDAPTWPGGLRDGDLAMLARSWSASTSVRYEQTDPGSRWTSLGNYGRRTPAGGHWRAALFHWTVQTDRLPSIPATNNFTSFRLLVFRDTQGFGRARSSRAVVPTLPGGGAVAIGRDADTSGDLTVLPGAGRGSVSIGWGYSPGGGTFGNPGWDEAYTRAYELLPPAGPGVPDILAPGDGDEITATNDVEFQWRYRPAVAGGRQDAYRLAVWDENSDPMYWSASTGTWSTTQTTNASSVEGVTLPPDAFSVGVTMWWQVATREGVDGRWSPWSSAASFTPVTPPSVTVTGPENVHDNLSPLVEWEASTPRGSQVAFQVQVYTGLAEPVYDSRVQPGDAAEWSVPAREWQNGEIYQARVRVQQTGGAWSAWSTLDFTLSWTEPPQPQLTTWPDKHGVLVEVEAPAGLDVQVERITGQGLWVPVGRYTAAGTHTTFNDVLAPYGQVTAYRARTANVLDGMSLTSPWGLSGQVVNTDRHSYLAAAADPLRTWVRLLIEEDGPHRLQRPVAVDYGLGDTNPRVSYGRLRGRTGQLTLLALTRDEAAGLRGLLHVGEPLVARWPAEREDTGPGHADAGQLVFDVSDEVDVARTVQHVLQRRRVSVPWVEQTATVGAGESAAPIIHTIGQEN